jgi:2-amino-4,5-dihydroxy-6-oxo-7-(phosphonooxy)heptanoate synthase
MTTQGGLAFGRALRLRRLYRDGGNRLLIVPLDHAVTDGPITESGSVGQLVARLADGGVDAVVLHKGAIRNLSQRSLTRTSLILHLSGSTRHAPDPDAKYLVATVEEALRLGADAVSVHVNLGSRDEHRQIADLASVSGACDRWNMPLLAMIYPRGPLIADPSDPTLVTHAATLAAELGADIVKVPYPGSSSALADVMAACPIPVITAGGPRVADEQALLELVDEVLRSGVAGLAMGRNIFQSPDPGRLARLIADRIHGAGAVPGYSPSSRKVTV